MRFSIPCGNHRGEHLVHHADEDQRQDGDERIGELPVGEWLRLLAGTGAVVFTRYSRAPATPVKVKQTGNQDESTADAAQPRRGVGIGLEKGDRDDVLDL